jgi:CDP-glucose 4,6-dehydratase
MGAVVSGFALNPPTQPNLFEQAMVGIGMTSIIGDIRDLEHLRITLADCQPEVVFHLAAQPLVCHSYQDPVETYSTNVMGTVHLFEAVRQASGVRVVVNVTSDKCYENREWVWGYRENEPMGGNDPYSSSKGCAELVTAAWRTSFFPPEDFARHGVALASARAGNVIGGGDWAPDRLVPDAIMAWHRRERVTLRSPAAIRPWQHVLEPLRGYLQLAERLYADGPTMGGGWNFGPREEDARPVAWLVERLAALWGADVAWTQAEGMQPQEAQTLKLDIAKSRAQLGWTPQWELDRALAETALWYRVWDQGGDLRAITLSQIAEQQTASSNAIGFRS